jgi:hypothetical protein
MANYTDTMMKELEAEGWEVDIRQGDQNSFVAFAKGHGHTCIGKGDGELGALIALKRSIRDLGPAGEIKIITGQISVPNADQFSRAVYVFGFESFQEQGKGVVTLSEGDMTRNEDGSVDAGVRYLSLDHQIGLIPREAIEMSGVYDPEREVVFAIVTGDGKAMVITLKLHDLS